MFGQLLEKKTDKDGELAVSRENNVPKSACCVKRYFRRKRPHEANPLDRKKYS